MRREEEKKKNSRIVYIDFLRVFATISVMCLHVSAQNWNRVAVTSSEWKTFCVYDCLVRWVIPIFVMISGALLLREECSIKKLYHKNIFRIFAAYVFWSAAYAILSMLQGENIPNAVGQFLQGHYHMWFLILIISMYTMVPLIKNLIKSEELVRYFLILSLIIIVIIPECTKILSMINTEIGSKIFEIVKSANVQLVSGYIVYFVLGYYLNKTELSQSVRCRIYVLSSFGFITTIVLTTVVSINRNEPTVQFFEDFALNIMLESVGVFVFFKYAISRINFSQKVKNLMMKLSEYSFGAYLVHAMVIEQLQNNWGLNTMSFHAVLSVPIITGIVFVISYLISFVLHQIPVMNKYII